MKMKYSADREEIETGCKYAENCFECPFSDCVIGYKDVDDTEEDYKHERKLILERARYVKSLRDSGMKLLDIANTLNCTVKTVRRDIIIAKEEEKKNAEQDGHTKN
jgi:DNA invertase Pin-like site-specific DNA recombinase